MTDLDPLISDLRTRIREIKIALVGSMTSRGLLHDVDLISARVDSLSAKVEELDAAVDRQGAALAVQPSPVVEVVKILASPSGVAIVLLLVTALAILIGGGLGQATAVRDIPHPLRQHHADPSSDAAPVVETMSDEDRAALKVHVLQELSGLLGDVGGI